MIPRTRRRDGGRSYPGVVAPPRCVLALALVAGLLGLAASPASRTQAAGPSLAEARVAEAEMEELVVVTGDGARHPFRVEVARTPAEQAVGLMYRRSLPADRGMLFVHPRPRPASMWMKNTFIPLDILFIAADGRIVRIAADTTPLSEASIPSGGAVRAVLEVNAGTAERLGIEAGDRVEHPAFDGAAG